MEFDYQILKLNGRFYRDHPADQYPEFLMKEDRAYNCLIVDTHEDYVICIPFRTDMRHRNGFRFRGSVRSRKHQSGLDYSKVILLRDSRYLGDAHLMIDTDEYREMVRNISRIVYEVCAYIDDYVAHRKGDRLLDRHEFDNRYRFSTLRYYHGILGIPA